MKKCVENTKELAENLKFFCYSAELLQQAVADALFMDRTTYTYYETGKVCPNVFTLIKIAKLFKVNLFLLLRKNVFCDPILREKCLL